MTAEELLKPRWKVIADFPESPYCINQILYSFNSKIFFEPSGYHFNPNDYPAIFKKLDWWEERSVDDMPDYLKWGEKGNVIKVNKHLCGIHKDGFRDERLNNFHYYFEYLPSTKDEYEKTTN